jgi:diaminopimelate decarboxylase
MNDVVVLHEMGAYTLASATQFNGIAPPAVVTRDLPVRIQEYGSRS